MWQTKTYDHIYYQSIYTITIHRNNVKYRLNTLNKSITKGDEVFSKNSSNQSHKQRSSDNISQITISTCIYRVKK